MFTLSLSLLEHWRHRLYAVIIIIAVFISMRDLFTLLCLILFMCQMADLKPIKRAFLALSMSLSLSSFCRYQKSQKNKHFSCVTLQWCSLYCSAINGCWKCSIMLHFLSTQLIMKNFHSLIYHSQARLYIEWDKINFCNYTSNMFKHSFFVFRIATHCQYSTYIIQGGELKECDLSANGKHKCLLQLLTHICGRFKKNCIYKFIEGEVLWDIFFI